ncbi:glycosyltransferase family 4 protein [soil metagenome]
MGDNRGGRGVKARASQTALAVARGVWAAAPSRVRDSLGMWVGGRLRDLLAGGARAPDLSVPAQASPIVVSAFFGGASGVAAAGRMTADALEAAGFAVIRHDLGALLESGGFQAHDLPGDPAGVWLLHANPPEAKLALARLRRDGWVRRFRIGYWAWELPRAPAAWLAFARAFHEVWAPTPFVRDSLIGADTRLVERPHPPPEVSGAAPDRARFGLPSEAVVFLAMADLHSGAARKNPLGAIEAFRLAWPQAQDHVVLLVKTHSASADPHALAALERAVEGRADIRVADGRLDRPGALSLIASCDVLLSLHRSEGFGLPIAEALALKRAVLATGWSGSETVLGDVVAARLPFSLVPVSDPGGPYDDPTQLWAEPDLAAAAERMRALAADPALRREIGEAGAKAVARLGEAWTPPVLKAEPWAEAVLKR